MSDGSLVLGRAGQRITPALGLLTDDRLARLAAGGSTAAFSAIYKRHYQAIYRYCLSIVGNEHDALDALQETMASALHALAGNKREISLRPWLFRIAHNEAITVLRRKGRETPVEEVRASDAEDSTQGRDDLRELIDDLGVVTERQRSAIVMRELSGLSFTDIGAALAMSPEGAKQAVYEGRCALQDLRAGRQLGCTEVRAKISAADRRLLRGRQIRAHLRACSDCREFEAEIRGRRERFAAIAPLPAPVALGLLQGLIGGGSGGSGIAVGTSASMAAVAKLGIAGVIAIGVGVGALEIRGGGSAPAKAAVEHSPGAPVSPASATTAAEAATAASAAHPGAKDSRQGDHHRVDSSRHHSDPSGDHGSRSAASGSHAGNAGASEQPVAADQQSDPSGDSSPAVTTSNGNGPASTPPGHGGTPPGHGGVPPGLGAPAPGHGGTPPGQSTSTDTSPGHSGDAPGQTGQTPASGATPPGQAGDEAPGHAGEAPGHAGEAPGHAGGG
jgi:RNA polymerase sigma factor (sigma-70 family)